MKLIVGTGEIYHWSSASKNKFSGVFRPSKQEKLDIQNNFENFKVWKPIVETKIKFVLVKK